MIRIEHLEKTFPEGGKVLKDVNAVINDGDVVAIIGPSGTGKSTLLRCINLLDPATGGKIFIGEDDITSPKCPVSEIHKKVSMVFQSYNLFEHLSVIENVMLPQVSVFKRDKQTAYDKGMELLRAVGMSKKKDSFPPALSGGQKQRVAIARTLAMDPEIILFDEPTSALDPSSVDEVKTVIRNVAKSGVTSLIVTHDMELARSISNKVFYMDQGIIYEEGTPEDVFEHPQKERTQLFLKKTRCLETDVAGKDFDYPALMSEIRTYGEKNEMPPRVIKNLQLITEELICSVLFRLLEEPFTLYLHYECDPSIKQVKLEVSYSGAPLNPMSLDKPDLDADIPDPTLQAVLALRLLRHYTDKIEYAYDPGEERPNMLRINLNME